MKGVISLLSVKEIGSASNLNVEVIGCALLLNEKVKAAFPFRVWK